jgi:SAM-dependent methyltransferase
VSTDKKTIDAYNKHAESWKQNIRGGNSVSIFHTYLEKPAMYSKLPNLQNKTVLCVGCGTGEEVKYLNSLGVKKIIGIDISEKLIELAQESYPDLEFHVMDVEALDFLSDHFDFVYSSLTMHYLESWTKALQSVNKVLKKNGIFLFSITHPFFSATHKTEDKKMKSRIFGFKDTKNSEICEIYGDYLSSRKLEIFIGRDLVVTNHHRPLSVIIKEIVNSGFEILDFIEPKAKDESKELNKNFWEIHQKIPEFMIFELSKK